jgi:phytoene dehydrogenase-like protein
MDFDAVIVGSGPNGLAAAIEIARAGHSVCVIEARDTIGGGSRSAALTLPGFQHDVCAAIHPLAVASPFFRSLPLAQHGLKWIHSTAALAHPFDEGPPALLYRSLSKTSAGLGADASAYEKVFSPFVHRAADLILEVLAPPIHKPRHPFLLMRFGLQAVGSSQSFIDKNFRGHAARGLIAGMAGHANMPLDTRPTAAFALLLTILGHAEGWPLVEGGSQRLIDALGSYLKTLASRAVIFDLTPRQILNLTHDQLPPSYRWELRKYRPGPGVFKVDWALSAPIPWKSKEVAQAATVHLGGMAEELTAGERIVANGRCPERPFVILAQQSLFDPSRVPEGKHPAWGYCHIPNGSKIDMTERIEAQIERFAPGFRDCILSRHVMTPGDLESYNPNYLGGDITGGAQNIYQVIARPALRANPYVIPVKGLFICSASTPPGGGVHGMCGYHAARAVLSTVLYNRGTRK